MDEFRERLLVLEEGQRRIPQLEQQLQKERDDRVSELQKERNDRASELQKERNDRASELQKERNDRASECTGLRLECAGLRKQLKDTTTELETLRQRVGNVELWMVLTKVSSARLVPVLQALHRATLMKFGGPCRALALV